MARAHQYPWPILAVVCLPVFVGALDLTIQMIARGPWPGFGWYSLGTGLLAVVLILLIFRYANPESPIQLGGLLTRLLVIQTFAWHIVLGWRLAHTFPEKR